MLKGIAVDLLSVENITNGRKKGFPAHKTLLGDNAQNGPLLLIEDVNLYVLKGENPVEVIAAPLRLIGLVGAPTAVLARMNG